MNANQQHMLDAYRAAQRGETAPPLPGRHDWEAIGEIRDHLRTDRPDARRRRKQRPRKGPSGNERTGNERLGNEPSRKQRTGKWWSALRAPLRQLTRRTNSSTAPVTSAAVHDSPGAATVTSVSDTPGTPPGAG